ncbi:karrikin insensitive 2 receptor CA [Physcomitrium patens]|uniref:AB hydrolase-1 domain-containing protein n=1 Tax=Physcomitrium patens TaxID=3218 RepID=A0A2K1KM94_PHYPA|nr:probable esterase D14L [Physcomitrium patens]PNR54891.1 hypothetical protein PHYPA_005784 [Physcomitrium patens]|eukprot:XP_024372547.1 probable esterase D14L [Physcomitrella patens]
MYAQEAVQFLGLGEPRMVKKLMQAEPEDTNNLLNPFLKSHNVRILGSGDEWLVFGHGFGSDQSVWQLIVPHFAKSYKILLFDLMGAGSTNPHSFTFSRYNTLYAHADDLLTILDELGIVSCTYIGHSMSGMIGCIASIERPSVFKKLVLIATSPRYSNDGDYIGGFEMEELHELFAAMRSNFIAWITGFSPKAVGSDIQSWPVQEFSRTFFNMRPDIALSICKTCFASDLRPLIPQVMIPCYLVQSGVDASLSIKVVKYMAANLGGMSHVDILQDIQGHLPHLTHPEAVIAVLQRAFQWIG